jgi:short-subunit dehydrogenase
MVIPANAGALKPDPKRETALITGASSGIGLDLARVMARDFDLILSARSQAKLEQTAGELQQQHGNHVHVIPADLARQEGPEQLFSEIKRRGLRVDALVNNAGFGGYGAFADAGLQTELEMIQLNITSLTHLTKLALPGMLERKHGRVMNVASTAGFLPGPLMAVYFATKAYVVSFSEAIANELKDRGITVTCLCPGATETGFAKRADMEGSRLFKMGTMSSSDVARAAYRAMMRGKTLAITGARNWLMVESVRLTPRKMATAIARSFQER